MPSSRHAVFARAILLTLSVIVQLQYVYAQNSPTLGLHARADNSTELQTEAKNKSTSTFITSLSTNAAIFVAQLLAFSVLRLHFKPIYEPRTYVPKDEKKRPPELGRFWEWPLTVWRSDFKTVLEHNGVDAYLYVRFHRMMVFIFGPIWVVSWAVLMPVTGVDGGGGSDGLDRFTFGNIGRAKQTRYWAHLGCAWVFTMWICGVIYFELKHFIKTRQNYLVSEGHSASAQANSILITGISDDYVGVHHLTSLFKHLPGGVRKVWLNHDLKDLPKVYGRRMKACNMLEKAETKLVAAAVKMMQKGRHSSSDKESGLPHAEKIVPRKYRPKHLLPFGPFPFGVPLLSKRVDTIDWARKEILEATQELEEGREKIAEETEIRIGEEYDEDRRKTWEKDNYPPLNSAFILFNNQISAHLAVQALVHHEPFKFSRKYIEVAPGDVIWSSLGLKDESMRIRTAISYALTAALIVFWSFPVALIGATSNVTYLCKTTSWLDWMCEAPQVVIGIVQGVLPPLLLALLMALLPRILRLFSRFEGVPRRTAIELSLMTRYFIFLVTHSFLIVTISSGLAAALPDLLENPASIPALLATELPKASTFFLTYVILQGLTGTGSGLLRIGFFIVYYLKLSVAGSTPRSLYNVMYRLKKAKFGEIFPEATLLAVIGIAYMVISPIINGLATATFFLFFEMEKYRFLYQFGQPASSDTGGLFFPRAIQHVFVGVYIQHICLAALFFLARDDQNELHTIGQAILMIVLLVFTMIYHSALNNTYGSLIRALPLTRADDSYKEIETRKRKGSRRRRPGLGARKRTGKYDPDADLRPTDFEHPATGEGIRPIWIPKDRLRLRVAQSEVKANESMDIPSGCENAKINADGRVEISGHPPGGPWFDGEYDE